MAYGSHRPPAREQLGDDRLKPRRFQIGPHAGRMAAGQDHAVDGVSLDSLIRDGVLEFLQADHLVVGGPSVAVGFHEWREKPQTPTRHRAWIGVSRRAVWRREDDAMIPSGQQPPWHSGFGRIEVPVRQRHQNNGHGDDLLEAPAPAQPILRSIPAVSGHPDAAIDEDQCPCALSLVVQRFIACAREVAKSFVKASDPERSAGH
jgi:hypothetical protein